MPELPEVEAVARALRPLVVGQTIRRCRVIHPIAVRPSSGRGAKQAATAMELAVRGQKIQAVERRGKYLILMLERGALVMHFRLDGQLIWFDSREITGHVDVAFEMNRGTLGFVDGRHFGRVQWTDAPEKLSGISEYGHRAAIAGIHGGAIRGNAAREPPPAETISARSGQNCGTRQHLLERGDVAGADAARGARIA